MWLYLLIDQLSERFLDPLVITRPPSTLRKSHHPIKTSGKSLRIGSSLRKSEDAGCLREEEQEFNEYFFPSSVLFLSADVLLGVSGSQEIYSKPIWNVNEFESNIPFEEWKRCGCVM